MRYKKKELNRVPFFVGLLRDFSSVDDVDASWQVLPSGHRANLHTIEVVDVDRGRNNGNGLDTRGGANELHLVDVAVAVGNGEAQYLLAFRQLLGKLTRHYLIGVPSASSGHLDVANLGHRRTADAADAKATC